MFISLVLVIEHLGWVVMNLKIRTPLSVTAVFTEKKLEA